MKISRPTSRIAVIAASFVSLISIASGHRLWVVASSTVLSGKGERVSVEGAISNDLFFPSHLALPLAATTVTSPGGKPVVLESATEGKIRTSFEMNVDEEGTYRVAMVNDMMFLQWEQDGETRHARGTPAEIGERDLAPLEKPEVSRWISRVETFVTCGGITPVKPTGEGVEFEFITHPNDLMHGEDATFRVLLDGKPHPGLTVSVVRGDDRFRDKVEEQTITSDGDGLVKVVWPHPGRYWLSAEAPQKPGEFKGLPLERGSAYFLTLDVMPQ